MNPSTEFSLEELSCPRCATPRMQLVNGRRLVCTSCGAAFIIAESLCPVCSLVNEPGPGDCARCGAPISLACPTCGTRNWAMAESCEHCGRALDAIEEMSSRWVNRTPARLAEQMRGAVDIKRREAEAATARSAALWEIDRQRQSQVHQALARRQAQERRLIVLSIAAIGLMILVVVAIVLLQGAG